jgi:hypothetical protein
MDADYSVELGPAAPALEIPWADPESGQQFVDLRTESESIDYKVEQITEVRDFPVLRWFLIELNSRDSAWQTAKCDVWTETAHPEENLYGAEFLHACYVDVVLAEAETSPRDSLDFHQRFSKRLARLLEEDDEIEASAEIVIRRCYFHLKGSTLEESEAGYCLTLFITGYGASAEDASNHWGLALKLAAECFRLLNLC